RSERYSPRFLSRDADIGLPNVDSLAKIERNWVLSKVVQGCLNHDRTVCDLRSDLDSFDCGIIAEGKRNPVVNPRCPADFFKISSRGNCRRQNSGMSADAHNNLVLPVPDCTANVKDGGCETW